MSEKTNPLLLSYRQAAKLLGVGRNQALHALIDSGHLRPVTLLGRKFIPRTQLEELANVGDQPGESPEPPTRKPPKRAPKSANAHEAAVRAFKVT